MQEEALGCTLLVWIGKNTHCFYC